MTTHNGALSGGSEPVTYTVLSTDSLVTIAAGLAAAINANSEMETLGTTASSSSAATLAFSQSFTGNGTLPAAASVANVSGTDGGGNVKTNGYQLSVAAGTTSTLTYDLNGNMTSDGTNSYSWDAENRLIDITYPGTNNFSSFVFDGKGRNVSIVETVAGSVTSTKQFVWCGSKRCEARNSSGTISAQYFDYGETISGTSYIFTTDHLGSIREMTNSSGVIQSQITFDPYGNGTTLQGSLPSDFQYAGYYTHAPSRLNLTRTRAYDSAFGRFINRDRIGESGGLNLYTYVSNAPIAFVDPSGDLSGGAGVGIAGAGGIAVVASAGLLWIGAQNLFQSLMNYQNWDDMNQCQQDALDCIWGCMQKKKNCDKKKKPEDVEREYRKCMSDCFEAYRQCIINLSDEQEQQKKNKAKWGWTFW